MADGQEVGGGGWLTSIPPPLIHYLALHTTLVGLLPCTTLNPAPQVTLADPRPLTLGVTLGVLEGQYPSEAHICPLLHFDPKVGYGYHLTSVRSFR